MNSQKSGQAYLSSQNDIGNQYDSFPQNNIETPSSISSKYRLISELGHGAQGNVFLAEELRRHQKVAIKQLRIESVSNWKQYDLFKREADVLSSLHIKGVAKFYDAMECLNETPPCAYIVQEFIPGKSIQTLLNEGMRFELYSVFDIALQILDILDQLKHHNPPVVHRDIKPSNLILSPQVGGGYTVYLIDFGAVSNPKFDGGSTVAGTFGYMAPEQLMGKPSTASDIYSLAAVIIHILSGISPAKMQVKDFRLMFEPDVQFLAPGVVKILREMLEPNVESRLSDIDQLKYAFKNFKNYRFDLDNKINFLDIKKLDNSSEYNRMLQNVRYYNENGNFELFQKLQDEIPRDIPSCYQRNIINLEWIDKDCYNIFSIKNIFSSGRNLLRTLKAFFGFLYDNLFQFLKLLGYILCIILIISIILLVGLPILMLLTIINPFLSFFKIFTSLAVTKKGYFNLFYILNICLWIGLTFLLINNIEMIEWIADLPVSTGTKDYIGFFFLSLFYLPSNFLYFYLKIKRNEYTQEMKRKGFTQDNNESGLIVWRTNYDSKSNTKTVVVDSLFGSIKQAFVDSFKVFYSKKNSYETTRQRIHHKYFELDYTNHFNMLIKNGAKTIARIVKVDYIPAEDVFIQTKKQKFCNYYRFNGAPTFKVTYCFNPPYDSRSENLLHDFYTHVDPETHYQVDDPLPILYMILHHDSIEEVFSMPFPLVLDDPISLCEIIGSSSVNLDPNQPQNMMK